MFGYEYFSPFLKKVRYYKEEESMKILFISLGCDKNLVDTEVMLELLRQKGYSFTDDENECDIVVVNTCCFIGDAKEESINALLEAAQLKKNGRVKALVAAGCLAQRYHRDSDRDSGGGCHRGHHLYQPDRGCRGTGAGGRQTCICAGSGCTG